MKRVDKFKERKALRLLNFSLEVKKVSDPRFESSNKSTIEHRLVP